MWSRSCQTQHGEWVVYIDLNDREVGLFIAADDFGDIFLGVVLKLDRYLVRAIDDVVVGDDQAVRCDHEARPLAALFAGLALTLALRAEELVKSFKEIFERMAVRHLTTELLSCGLAVAVFSVEIKATDLPALAASSVKTGRPLACAIIGRASTRARARVYCNIDESYTS